MSEPLYRHLRYRVENGVLIVTPTPAKLCDEDLADAVRQDLLDAVTTSGATKVVLDLQALEEMSSVGFWPLLRLYRKLKDNDGKLVLCNLRPGVAAVLHGTRMISTSGVSAAPFEEAPDEAAAVARLAEA